jgi:hypothetical protein
MSTIVRYKLEDIKKQIKEKESRQYLFLINPKKSVLIAKATTKKDAIDIVKEKISNKPKKYEDQIIRRFQIKFRDEKDIGLNSGSILVLIDHLKVIDGKLKPFYIKGEEGPIWFTKDWLQLSGWNKEYIVRMTEYIRKKKVKISGIGTNIYEVKFDKIL